MTTFASRKFYESDDYVVASLNAEAVSEARSALQWTYPSKSRRTERAEEIFQLCDLFHNVAMWLVEPTSRPPGSLSALDAVLRQARQPWVREWLRHALASRNRPDLVARLDSYQNL